MHIKINRGDLFRKVQEKVQLSARMRQETDTLFHPLRRNLEDMHVLASRACTFLFDPPTKRVKSLIQEEYPLVIEQQQFTETESSIVAEILATDPDSTPFASMLSAFTSQSFDRCQRQVIRALDEGDFDQLIRPVRNVVSRIRVKMHVLGIAIDSIIETGYMFLPDTDQRSRRGSYERK